MSLDWCTFAADLTAVLEDQGWHKSVRDTYLDLDEGRRYASTVAAGVFAYFFAGCNLQLSEEVKSARFYTCSVEIQNKAGDMVGLIQFGGANTLRKDGTRTVRVELTGQGCRYYEAGAGGDHAERWSALRAKLESVGGRLARADVAFDDMDGVHNVALARTMWETDQFTAQGGRPTARLFDDLDTKKGKTLYIGAPTSEKQMRVYEKGRELGDKLSEWVRWEVQFRASNRKPLPLDMLENPVSYMRGAYPALTFIQAVMQKIDATAEAAIATVKSALRHVRRQYGATLNAIARQFPSDADLAAFVRTLTRPKLPAWASKPIGSSDWPVVLAKSTT
ncbi:MAG TPA: replication initiation factor domain-containing protein [Hyphomicrobiales bacterium]|nr:replication initiation factor domain-containing protein [Hyphomicrobiales bacterium]